METGEGVLTPVEGPDGAKDLQGEETEALGEPGNPERLKSWRSGPWLMQLDDSPDTFLWVWLPLVPLSVYLDSLYISGSQPWLQSESPGELLQHLIPDQL